jgi:hypothetical protein
MSARLELEIGRLVLTGLGRADGERAVAAFARELERLCEAGPIPRASALAGELVGEPIRIGPRLDPERIGADAARSVRRSLAP